MGPQKEMRRCVECNCTLRRGNEGPKCWTHTYPGFGKTCGSEQDMVRGSRARIRLRGRPDLEGNETYGRENGDGDIRVLDYTEAGGERGDD